MCFIDFFKCVKELVLAEECLPAVEEALETLAHHRARDATMLDAVKIVLMTGDMFAYEVRTSTTVKDLKIFLGTTLNRDPKHYRLLLDDREIKVRGEDGRANLLALYTGLTLTDVALRAIISYSSFTGMRHVSGAVVDQYGNASGTKYDLGVDGAFVGLKVVVLQLYTGNGFDFRYPKDALEEKGFTVVLWTSVPTLADFDTELRTACQFWLVSGSKLFLTGPHVECIKQFYEEGRGVYIWGDNDPFYADANVVSRALLGNVYLQGDDPGATCVGQQRGAGGVGFDPNCIIFTGITNLYEGVTIARVASSDVKAVQPIMISSHGYPVTSIVDDGKHRLAIDGGFTRLYVNWDEAGTSRFIKNISAWLCGIDADWV